MKKVIKGAVYNVKTAKMICERISKGPDYGIGEEVEKIKQLFKTKSGKYFFFINKEFETELVMNNDDLDPIYERRAALDSKIEAINYKLAFEFAKEVNADTDTDSKSKERIAQCFPEIIDGKIDGNLKIQKKFYLSEKASWYLEMMLIESEETNSSFVEKLIVEEYRKLYSMGTVNNDPYYEIEE